MRKVFLAIAALVIVVGTLSRCQVETAPEPATTSQLPPDRLKDI